MLFRPIVHCSWGLISDSLYDKQIEIFVDTIPPIIKNNNIRIIIIQESHNTKHIVDFVMNNQNSYDYVFTYYDDILKSNKKSVKFLCINTWIHDYVFKEKKFGVSTLVGGKRFKNLYGHQLRHELWEKQNKITIPKYFWLSSHYRYEQADYTKNLILRDQKNPLFDTMFHIVIENTSINNVFTEKLIDCFQTKTIPILWGAPNIGDYFNIDGIYIANNVDDMINISNNLIPEFYADKEEYIEDNYNRSMNYLSQTQILDRKLDELFK